MAAKNDGDACSEQQIQSSFPALDASNACRCAFAIMISVDEISPSQPQTFLRFREGPPAPTVTIYDIAYAGSVLMHSAIHAILR